MKGHVTGHFKILAKEVKRESILGHFIKEIWLINFKKIFCFFLYIFYVRGTYEFIPSSVSKSY